MTEILYGKPVAEAISERSRKEAGLLLEKGIKPTLAVFRVGEKDADLSYERGIMKRCEETGVKVVRYLFDEDVSETSFYHALQEANDDDLIHGILVFRPLDKRFDDERLRNSIRFDKDVDGCGDASLTGVFTGRQKGFAPCTAQAVIELLDHYGIDLAGKNVVVIGRSLVIGKPVAMLALNRNATVTVCHSKTSDLASICSKADILICATGQMESIGKDYVNSEQIVIDVGIDWNPDKNKLCGDVLFEEVAGLVRAITPVPGGIGSITTSVLIDHVTESAIRKNASD